MARVQFARGPTDSDLAKSMIKSFLSGSRVVGPATVLLLVVGTVLISAQTPAAEAAKEFQTKIQDYMAIHRMANTAIPPRPSKVTDVKLITEHEKQLAAAIRALRPKADRGDVFTPRVRTMIANVINSKLDANARSAILSEGNPRSDVSTVPISLAINATYPASAPLSTV